MRGYNIWKHKKTIATIVAIVTFFILILISPLPTQPECSGSGAACTYTDPDSPDSTPVSLNKEETLSQQRTFKTILFGSIALCLGSMAIPVCEKRAKRWSATHTQDEPEA